MKKLLSKLEAIVVTIVAIVTIVTFTAVVNSKATKTNTITTLEERVAVAIDTDNVVTTTFTNASSISKITPIATYVNHDGDVVDLYAKADGSIAKTINGNVIVTMDGVPASTIVSYDSAACSILDKTVVKTVDETALTKENAIEVITDIAFDIYENSDLTVNDMVNGGFANMVIDRVEEETNTYIADDAYYAEVIVDVISTIKAHYMHSKIADTLKDKFTDIQIDVNY